MTLPWVGKYKLLDYIWRIFPCFIRALSVLLCIVSWTRLQLLLKEILRLIHPQIHGSYARSQGLRKLKWWLESCQYGPQPLLSGPFLRRWSPSQLSKQPPWKDHLENFKSHLALSLCSSFQLFWSLWQFMTVSLYLAGRNGRGSQVYTIAWLAKFIVRPRFAKVTFLSFRFEKINSYPSVIFAKKIY